MVLWPGISLLSLVTNFPWRVNPSYWTDHQKSSKKWLCNKPSMTIFTKYWLWKVVVVDNREQLEIVMKFWKRKSKTKIKYLTSLLWLAPWDQFCQNYQKTTTLINHSTHFVEGGRLSSANLCNQSLLRTSNFCIFL